MKLRSRKVHPKRFQKLIMVVKWKRMNPQGNEWNLLCRQNMKITLQAKDITSITHYKLVHKFIPDATSDENSGCKSRSGQGMKKARNDSSMATGQKSKALQVHKSILCRKRWNSGCKVQSDKEQEERGPFSKHKETKRKSTLLHWWTYVTSKMRS